MAFDEDLAARMRSILSNERGVTEKRMFGGLAFLVNGNMAATASGQGGVMVRVEPSETDRLVRAAHARRVEMRGREMDGWVRVDVDGVRTKRQLETWVGRGVAYARSLPPKETVSNGGMTPLVTRYPASVDVEDLAGDER
jgi:TfoX/Sxy family transcriptional regulator of competence genes